MELQTILNNAMIVRRAEEMKTSPQLTLGELILKLEVIERKDFPVVFDVKEYYPTSIRSWRGSYNELALGYTQVAGGWLSVTQIITLLKEMIGKTLEGYKGGDYLMGKTTPVWVANYGESAGFREGIGIHDYLTGVVDVLETKDEIVIKTKALEY